MDAGVGGAQIDERTAAADGALHVVLAELPLDLHFEIGGYG